MSFLRTTANDLELKYDHQNLDLIWEYIGPERTHGDSYYNNDFYCWFECLSPTNDLIYSNGTPNAIICFAENVYLPFSLHISVFEVFKDRRGEGIGTQILSDLFLLVKANGTKTITLQAHDRKARKFYKKLDFKDRKINGIKILRKYL
jgi:GNAT superfamily N-acetyltransferase